MSFLEILIGIFQGVSTTLLVTVFGLCVAGPFAIVFGTMQFLATGAARLVVTSVIEFWRSSPVIVLLFCFYYALPLFGLQLPALLVGSVVLGLNSGGYASQAIRAGLETLPRGQREAGSALGLSRMQILRFIELPQVVANMAPTFFNNLIQLMKGTALLSLITLSDMTFRAKELSQIQYNPVGIYTALLVAYFLLCYPIALLGRWAEASVGKGRRQVNEL